MDALELILNSLTCLLGLLLFFVFLLALLSPLEALSWWAGWSKQELRLRMPEPAEDSSVDTRPDETRPASSYIVYLSGILAFSNEPGHRELALMEGIAARLPGDEVVIGDVFPYSVMNNPLNGERTLKWLWNWLKDHQAGINNPFNVYNLLILARNLFQVAVSADPRYGPINNVGVAAEIARSLFRHGYPPGSGKPVYLIGYSGGGQISVGAARYLHAALHAPIYVIGLGGVFTGDPGIASVAHLYQLKGRRDFILYLGNLLFPGRWPILPHSPWNRARREGRITEIDPGPVWHFGPRDYFGRSAKLPDGTSYSDRTADLVVQAILGQLPDRSNP